MRRFFVAVVAFGSILGVGVDGHTYEAVKVEKGGTITGVVKFIGKAKAPKKIKVTRDVKICGKEPKFDESLIVSPKGGVKNAVVSLVDIKRGKAQEAPASPKLDQNGCRFIPHVLLIPAGTTFSLVNSDGILHNFHTTSVINPTLNKAQPRFKKVLKIRQIKHPEIIKVNCDVHEWMHAWIVATEHPYYALTDEDGSFTLNDIPPGKYTLQVWHETLGKQTKEVTVREEAKTKLTVEFKP